jgi:hypothetical protein
VRYWTALVKAHGKEQAGEIVRGKATQSCGLPCFSPAENPLCWHKGFHRDHGAKYLLLVVIAAEKLEKQNADNNAEDDGHRPLPNV